MLANIKIIHLEVEFMEIYSGQPLMADIKNYLNRNGFSLYAFTNFGRYSGDAVFVNNSLNGGHPIPGTKSCIDGTDTYGYMFLLSGVG